MRNLFLKHLGQKIICLKQRISPAKHSKIFIRCTSSSTVIRSKYLLATKSKITEQRPCYIRLFSEDAKIQRQITVTDDGITVTDDGRQLCFQTNNGNFFKFDSVWLRFNCHCQSCKQEHSGQRMLDVADIDIHTTIQSAEVKGKLVKLRWSDHEGEVPVEFLRENYYVKNNKRFSWIREPTLPTMKFKEMSDSQNGVLKWLRDINDAGSCLLTDVPTEDKMVAKVAEHMAPVQHTIYGTTFDVRSVPNPINVAYSSASLDFHMDLVYYESPPGIQLLQCIQFDDCVKGGESMLLDVFHVAELFRNEHPDEFKTLTKIPATFQKVHFEREFPVYMKYQRPHIVLNHREEIVNVNWAPAFEGPLSVSQEHVIPYYKAYHKFAKAIKNSPDIIRFKLNEGDLIAFNNRRILHSRTEFQLNNGVRHLQGCYVNIDEFKSKIEVLAIITGDKKPLKHVGNQCWMTTNI